MTRSREGPNYLAEFERLVTEYADRIYRVTLRITGSPADAEDAMQEAFLSGFEHWETFRGESSPVTWLYRIAVNAAVTRLRQKHRQPAEPLEAIDESLSQSGQWGGDVSRYAELNELQRQIEKGIASLPEEQRIVLVLRDAEGMSTAEVARILQITEANVKTRLHRARLTLRDYLAPFMSSR
jgi:RNA polymerase sigma-70 factor (ECF subfamily)